MVWIVVCLLTGKVKCCQMQADASDFAIALAKDHPERKFRLFCYPGRGKTEYVGTLWKAEFDAFGNPGVFDRQTCWKKEEGFSND